MDTNGKELKQVDCFKYLGTVMETEGGLSKAVKQRVKSALMKWREMSGVICDRKIPKELKSKVYKSVLRPVML